jgi:NAD(P)-dependent dehydrogenase (short-subunit alcohol dehydrogenase family)
VRVLVFGARRGSLGEAVTVELATSDAHSVITAGPNGEDYHYHSDEDNAGGLLEIVNPDVVVWTVGINSNAGMERHLYVNCVVPLRLIDSWLVSLRGGSVPNPKLPRQFVGISSNSAHIARAGSVNYCASKAAFSMGLRVKGREVARSWKRMSVYGYEPGLLAGTPMTAQVAERLPKVNLHRMPGVAPEGLDRYDLARIIVGNLASARSLNGCMIRVDAGEQ